MMEGRHWRVEGEMKGVEKVEEVKDKVEIG